MTELFESQVQIERGQIQARLHSLDQDAANELSSRLSTSELPVSHDEFLQVARSAGKRSKDGLVRDYQRYVGRPPSNEEHREINRLVLTENDADFAPSAWTSDDSPFIFPSVDGDEMTNRWDMQADPPDILITNVSMLSAMLNREVEEPIFAKTREWLAKDPDSYFYLILDELHLQRGAAGTEVSYLIRLLFQRLGLTTSDEQQRKIRILASSASLPATPEEEAEKSAKYLWDMFGSYGLTPGLSEESAKDVWLRSIVPGNEQKPKYSDAPQQLDANPFLNLLELHTPTQALDSEFPRARPLFAIPPDNTDDLRMAWNAVADALAIKPAPLPDRIEMSIQECADRLAWACREKDSDSDFSRSRAIPVSELAGKLFKNKAPDWQYSEMLESVRGLLFVRGCGDGLRRFLKKSLNPASFRVHTFFRSIEGLYAPAVRGAGSLPYICDRTAEVGVLSIEHSSHVEVETPSGQRKLRNFELSYCECCGELFMGGMRAPGGRQYLAELLPQEPNLEGLPDQSISQRFEDLSWEQYGLFWPGPWTLQNLNDTTDDDDRGVWLRAYLERDTGGVLRADRAPADTSDRLLPGWYYNRNDTRQDAHDRTRTDRGTNVPYACPKCGTSYVGRSPEFRLSPIRNFRAGFAKTTQLLATELFDAQRVSNPNEPPKLVSFSDSRQDAAKAALSIERLHHQDIRRELLYLALRNELSQRAPDAARNYLDRAIEDLEKTPESFREMAQSRVKELEEIWRNQAEPSVSLRVILEDTNEVVHGGNVVKPFIANMVSIGVHPFDDAGQKLAKGDQPGDERPIWYR
ncbi:MAG: hypothetical protein IPM23_21975 [Candidatus Melainabacteria bacterium]|nr:hypothetical protein [Candidatus Melainabacteria bacterium]